jgi:hypothetical protein
MLNFGVDDNLKEFNKTFNEYIKFTKRQPAEIVNGKLYFIALQAMRATKTADKLVIEQKLTAPSRNYPDVSLAAVLVNLNQRKKNKKGLFGQQMVEAVQKLIKKQQSRTQFLRSGWIQALKVLDYWNRKNADNLKFVKRFAPKRPDGVRQYGKPKGSCIYARPDRIRTYGVITNTVGTGRQATPTVRPILLKGLKAGIIMEMRSMKQYIENVKFKEAFKKIKSGGHI